MALGFRSLRLRGFHTLRPDGPVCSARPLLASIALLLPRPRLDAAGLGSCAFARRYSRNHFYFLFLRVLRCFNSPGSLFRRKPEMAATARCRVPPFGHRGINGYLLLHPAFRSLSRPSSPTRDQASHIRPSFTSSFSSFLSSSLLCLTLYIMP